MAYRVSFAGYKLTKILLASGDLHCVIAAHLINYYSRNRDNGLTEDVLAKIADRVKCDIGLVRDMKYMIRDFGIVSFYPNSTIVEGKSYDGRYTDPFDNLDVLGKSTMEIPNGYVDPLDDK